jgi:hypothetical protein
MKFDKPAALNRDTHRHLRLRPPGDFAFARALHAAPISVAEFYAVATEYAIVFVRSARGEYLPVVVLGVKPNENLFLSEDGRWQARYVPLSVRAFPFGLAETPDPMRLQVLIDEAYAGFGDAAGSPLFADSGDPAPELESTLERLQAQLQNILQTRTFGAELDRLGLLTERGAELRVAADARLKLAGFWMVDEARLQALDDANLLLLARRGHLSLITAHLLSIGNLDLLARKTQPIADATPTPSSAPAERATRPAKARGHA